MATFNNGESGSSIRTKINNVLQHLDGTSGAIVINDAGADVDFRVESDTQANALFVDGATGNVGIRTSAPLSALNVAGTTGITWGALSNSSGLVTIGTQGATGGSLFVNTQSVNANYASGLAVDGTYASTLSTINLRALGVKDPGYSSRLVVSTTSSSSEIERFRLTNLEAVFNDPGNDYDFRVESDTNTHALFVDGATGNVGIGTSSTAPLGPNITTVTVNGTSGGGIQFQRTDATAVTGLVSALSGAFALGSITSTPVTFRTNNTERLRITSTGNVGIGTSSPSTRLHVAGGDATFDGNAVFSSSALITASSGNFLRLGSNGSERLRIDSSGNLLVGTTDINVANQTGTTQGVRIAGASNIQAASTGIAAYFNKLSTDGALVEFRRSGVTVGSIGAASGGIYFGSGSSGTERMRIDSSGNVGIGTGAPTATLTVLGPNTAAGGIALTTSTSDATSKFARIKMQHYTNAEEPVTLILGTAGPGANTVQIGGGSGVENAATEILFLTAANTTTLTGSERLRIDSSGNVLIGGTTAGTASAGNLVLFNGTAPTGNVTNGVTLYAEDVSASSELKVRDEAGNITTLSPHNFDLIPEGPSEEMAWSYYSERDGKRINVDMLKAIRLLEQITGEKLVHMT